MTSIVYQRCVWSWVRRYWLRTEVEGGVLYRYACPRSKPHIKLAPK